jgi:hypothetical protein
MQHGITHLLVFEARREKAGEINVAEPTAW